MEISKAEHDRIVKEFATQVNHRANNLLSVIQGIIRMSDGESVDTFKSKIEGRICALSQAHSLLSETNWEAVPLLEIIQRELSAYVDLESPRLHLLGQPIMLPAARAQNAAMLMHELATNSTKYGALKSKEAHLTIKWELGETGLDYSWIETGLTGIVKPVAHGSGLRLVEQIARGIRADVKFHWLDTGLQIDFHQPYSLHRSRESLLPN